MAFEYLSAELTSFPDALVAKASWCEKARDHEQDGDDAQGRYHDDEDLAPGAKKVIVHHSLETHGQG